MRNQRLLLVVTARTDDPAYATARPLLGELERIDHSLSVHLERLQPQHVDAMARALGAQTWSADQVAALAARSEGVPYFVEELVRGGVSSDDGVPPAGSRTVRSATGSRGSMLRRAASSPSPPSRSGTRPTVSWREQPTWPSRSTSGPSARPCAEGFSGADGRGGYRFRHALLGGQAGPRLAAATTADPAAPRMG